MSDKPLLVLDGEVERPLRLTLADLAALEAAQQVPDVSQLDSQRRGTAVRLAGLLERAQVRPGVTYLGLHSSSDDFHASIPLQAVAERALIIYELEGQPLAPQAGGPLRFFIPNYAQCHTAEIDECANVKHVDRIELTRGKGFDNRPTDDEEHRALHEGEGGELRAERGE